MAGAQFHGDCCAVCCFECAFYCDGANYGVCRGDHGAFLFVIMLLGAEQLQGISGVHGSERYHRAVAFVLVALLVVGFGVVIFNGGTGGGNGRNRCQPRRFRFTLV